jgi:hypothetical protein
VRDRLTRHKRIPRRASGRYLLVGLIRCQACGTRMHGERTARRSDHYRCQARARGATAPACGRVVPVRVLNARVLSDVGAIIDTLDRTDPALRAALRRAWDALTRPECDAVPISRAAEKAAQKARDRIKRLALLYADGEIDRQGYDLGRAQAQADLDAAEAELQRLRPAATPTPAVPSLDDTLGLAGGWRDAIMTGDTERQREVLGEMIECVVPERIARGQYLARITWTSTGDHLARLVAAARGAESAA